MKREIKIDTPKGKRQIISFQEEGNYEELKNTIFEIAEQENFLVNIWVHQKRNENDEYSFWKIPRELPDTDKMYKENMMRIDKELYFFCKENR